MKLVKLEEKYRSHLEEMMEEWLRYEDPADITPWAIVKWGYRDFENYMEHLEVKDDSEGLVPDSTFFCLDEERDRFVGAVNRLIDMLTPTHVAVIFDSETQNPRFQLLDEYKANRPDYSALSDDENPFSQLPDIYRALDFMGIAHTEAVCAECDDVIASYALTADTDTEVYISSFDSDYFQLITDRVKIIRYKGAASVICDREYINQKLGIEPELYADYKSLVGDTADNIPGVRGIGPKTAAKIINGYGSLCCILSNTSRVCEEKLRASLEESREILTRNLALIRLDTHAPLPFDYGALAMPTVRYRTMDVIRGINI